MAKTNAPEYAWSPRFKAEWPTSSIGVETARERIKQAAYVGGSPMRKFSLPPTPTSPFGGSSGTTSSVSPRDVLAGPGAAAPPPSPSDQLRKLLRPSSAPVAAPPTAAEEHQQPAPHIRHASAIAYDYENAAMIPEDVRQVFHEADSTKNGYLDYAELKEALRSYGYDAPDKQCIDLVQQYDDDQDGVLSLYEFFEVLLDLSRHQEEQERREASVPKLVSDAFADGDSNGSGHLGYLELQEALRSFSVEVSVDECIQLLQKYDDDHDGKLDLVSFDRLVQDLVVSPVSPLGSPTYGLNGWRRGLLRPDAAALPAYHHHHHHHPADAAAAAAIYQTLGGPAAAVHPATAAAHAAAAAAAAAAAPYGGGVPLLPTRPAFAPPHHPASLLQALNASPYAAEMLYQYDAVNAAAAAAAHHHGLLPPPYANPYADWATASPYHPAAAAYLQHPYVGHGVGGEPYSPYLHERYNSVYRRVRPLGHAGVRLAFDTYDDTGKGILDTRRARRALHDLGARLSHGETAQLVRRFGGFVKGNPDAVVSLHQFTDLVAHLNDSAGDNSGLVNPFVRADIGGVGPMASILPGSPMFRGATRRLSPTRARPPVAIDLY